MRGYRRGTSRTSVGIGFDLLAGLTVSEVEGVLAHELAHARLVQRGFSRWLKKGLARLSQVTTELSACAAAYRQANARSDLTRSEEHTSELQSQSNLVCRLLLEKKKNLINHELHD